MQVILMAGGSGSRLRPLTTDRPKPFLPIANRPLVEHLLSHLAAQRFRNVTLTLHHHPEAIQALLGHRKRLGLHLAYSIEDEPLGTAGGVKRAMRGRYPTVVVSGDIVTDIELTDLVAAHRRSGAAATIAVLPVADPHGFGVVSFDPHGRISRFCEKPVHAAPGTWWINCGIYVLEPDVFDTVPDGRAYDFSRDLFPRLLRTGRALHAWPAHGYWCDAGTPNRYLRANLDVLGGRTRWTVPGSEESGRSLNL